MNERRQKYSVKHSKKPTRAQKLLLDRMRLNPADWLVSKDTPEYLLIVSRYSSTTTRMIMKRRPYYDN